MILVDTSYLVYYNGFAVWRWYTNEFGTKHIPDDGSFDPMTDPEFKAMYEKKLISRILNVIHNDVVFFDRSELTFCLDCSRSKIWRLDIFPEYKMMRRKKKDEKKEFSWNGIFNYTQDIMLPQLADSYGSKIIKHPHAEGDDVIAALTNLLWEQGRKDTIIIASDGDITQLSDKALIITLKGEKKSYTTVMDKYKLKENIVWDKDLFLIHKSIMGDGGDEIPGIMQGYGPKRAAGLLSNINILEQLLNDNPAANERFKINTQLINFDYIPKEIVDNIVEQYNTEEENSLLSL